MTYSLSHDLADLLKPARLVPASEILADRRVIPADPGVYAWWFRDSLPRVSTEGTLNIGEYRLLYVGIAPRAPSRKGTASRSNLRKRIRSDHLGTRIGSSTLRRSLAALLGSSLAFAPRRNDAGRPVMAKEEEARLTAWMAENAAVSNLPHPQPWDVEAELIANGPSLPLNIAGSSRPGRNEMLALRSFVNRPIASLDLG